MNTQALRILKSCGKDIPARAASTRGPAPRRNKGPQIRPVLVVNAGLGSCTCQSVRFAVTWVDGWS